MVSAHFPYLCTIEHDKMKKVLAIVGRSGVGKTLVMSYLERLGCNNAVSHTTRPMREGEVNGREHYFVRTKPQKTLISGVYGGYDYWVNDEDFKDGCNAYIIDAESLLRLREIMPVRTMYIKRDNSGIDKERTARDNGILVLDESFYDYVIENSGTKEELYEKVREIWEIERNQL